MNPRYTKESLIEINQSYDSDHSLNDDDVNKVNDLVERLETQAKDNEVHCGDVVVLINKDNKVLYISGHIEKDWSEIKDFSICTQAYVPFTNVKNLNTSASGGYWMSATREELQYIGKRVKRFGVWGHCGGTANGQIQFNATVNLWLCKKEDLY